MENFKKLKRAVIKEELVAITGNFIKAILLNQFIYWTKRLKDFDKFIEEENKRLMVEGKESNFQKTEGWIYKSAEDLSDETMLGLSIPTIRKYLEELTASGYLEKRNNPNHLWDKTLQYRLNLLKIKQDLEYLGYPFEGFFYRDEKNLTSNLKNLKSSLRNLNAIPKIIINNNKEKKENNIKEKKESKLSLKEEKIKKEYQEVVDHFNACFKRRFKAIDGNLKNFTYWRELYNLQEIKEAIKIATTDNFWYNKLTPTILFRRKNPQGEPVDYIGGFLNKKRVYDFKKLPQLPKEREENFKPVSSEKVKELRSKIDQILRIKSF